MNIQMKALKIENIMRIVFPSYENQASIIREAPYEEIENFLQKLVSDHRGLKLMTEVFLEKYQAMGKDSLDKAYENGFDIDRMTDDLKNIVDIAMENIK